MSASIDRTSSASRPLEAELANCVRKLDELAGAAILGSAEARIAEETVKQLLTVAVKLYVLKRIDNPDLTPFKENVVSATDVAIVTTDMLRAVNLELFELGLWNSWGRG